MTGTMILSAQSIRKRGIITPFCERTVYGGMSYGLSQCGYDIRTAQNIVFHNNKFELASTIEHFTMPNNLMARVCDKSSWARKGIAVQNTIIEPGWRGYLTLEITFHKEGYFKIRQGYPIAQVVFEQLDESTEQPYEGKYQDQPAYPMEAIDE